MVDVVRCSIKLAAGHKITAESSGHPLIPPTDLGRVISQNNPDFKV